MGLFKSCLKTNKSQVGGFIFGWIGVEDSKDSLRGSLDIQHIIKIPCLSLCLKSRFKKQ